MSVGDGAFCARTIQARLARADALGVFPPAAVRILEVVDDPGTNLVDLEKAVSLDPVLAGQVLKVANSPCFGMTRTVGSVRKALFVLGFRTVRNMALALAMTTLRSPNCPWSGRIWRRAMRTCHAMRQLGGGVAWEDHADPFTVGLLHRLGAALLLVLEEHDYSALLDAHPWGTPALRGAEVHRFGCDQASLGAACLERWALPSDVCLAVRHQDDAEALARQPEARTLARMLAVAVAIEERRTRSACVDAIVREIGEGPPARALGLDHEAIARAAAAVDREEEFFG